MAEGKKKFLHIGADLEDIKFVEQFRGYCLKEDFKQKTLIERLIKWWIDIDEPIQWLIYRGKYKEAHLEICKLIAAHNADQIVTGSEADSARQTQRKGRSHSSKAG